MLDHLEIADGLAELLALLGIIQRGGVQHLQHAAGFGAQGGGGFINHGLDQRQRFFAQHMFGAHGDIFEIDFAGRSAVHGQVIAAGDALGIGRDQQQRHAARIALAAGSARGDEQVRGM